MNFQNLSILAFIFFLVPKGSLANENFITLDIQAPPYSGWITIYKSIQITWVDFLNLKIEGDSLTKSTRFIKGFYRYNDPTLGQAFAIDFKDGATLIYFNNFKEVAYKIAGDPDVLYRDASSTTRPYFYYHERFPSRQESSPIFIEGLNKTFPRRNFYGEIWTPLELQQAVAQKKPTCKSIFQ